jgi:hypothetical protein
LFFRAVSVIHHLWSTATDIYCHPVRRNLKNL